MEILGTPLVTIILNVVASFLVAKGIIDASSKEMVVQLLNNLLAGIITTSVAVISIVKAIDLHKHKLTVSASTPPSIPAATPLPPVNQTGLPLTPQK